MLVLTFIGLPFVVRTVQPVLESLEAELEEAAWLCWARAAGKPSAACILPPLLPALVTGFALAFARGLGEYGSVVFVSGNMPFQTEIAPVLIVARLEEFAYGEATAIAVVLLADVVRPAGGHQPARTLEQAPCKLNTPTRPAQSVDTALAAGTTIRRGSRLGADPARPPAPSAVLVIVPVVNVFYQALAARRGVPTGTAWSATADTRHAILLTLTVAPVAVVANLVFGVAAAWVIARFRFPGRTLLTDADRPAVLGLAGRGGADLRAAVRPARLLRPLAARARLSRSSSPRRA